MQLITIFLNAILSRCFSGHYARKFELDKLTSLMPFEFPDNDKVVKAVEKFWQTGLYVDERLTGIVPVGLLAQRKEFNNPQSEFEGVYVCRVYFGRDEFATLHIYEDGTWKEYATIDHETGRIK